MTTFIFGAGYSGREIGRQILHDDQAAIVYGTTRSADTSARLERDRIRPLLFDVDDAERGLQDPQLAAALSSAHHLVISIAPGDGPDALALALRGGLHTLAPALRAITYLSTVGVYGDHDGKWVDETTVPKPVSARSLARLDAETLWSDVAADAAVPLSILRLSGIYGPGRNAIRTALDGGARRLVKPGQVFNRIRVEDIGRATAFLVARGAQGIFNVTDDRPAPPQDVVAFACQLCGVALPPETDFETARLSPMARSFYGENKRVSNARIKALGFSFLFPDYEPSLTDLWVRQVHDREM